MHEIETKAYGPAAKRARRSHSTVDEMEVDPPEASSAPAARTAKPKKASSGKKRRAAVLSSDDDDFVDAATHAGNRDRRGSSPLPSLDVSDGDYDYDLPAARSNPVRQKNPTWKVRDAGGSVSVSGNGNRVRAGTAAKGGGGMGASKIGKGKAVKKESKEITMKDERKGTRTPPVKRETSAPNGQARAQSKESQPQVRSRLQVKKEDKEDTEAHDVPLDIINDPAPSSPAVLVNNEDPMQPAPASVTVPAPAATLPKKIKLPTIRKNKAPSAGTGTGTGTSTPTQTQGKQPPALTSTTPGAPTSDMSAAPAGGTRKVPGTSDFDLRDKSAWASIFKQVFISLPICQFSCLTGYYSPPLQTGGSTPRSGLSRREKEDERRKELYKMRDEARTMREEGLVSAPALIANFITNPTIKPIRNTHLIFKHPGTRSAVLKSA